MWCSVMVRQWEAEEVGFSPWWIPFILLFVSYYFPLLQKASSMAHSHPVGVPSPLSPPLHLLVSPAVSSLVHPPHISVQPFLNTFSQRHHLFLCWVKCWHVVGQCDTIQSTVEPAGNGCEQHRAASDISHTHTDPCPYQNLPVMANMAMFHQGRT